MIGISMHRSFSHVTDGGEKVKIGRSGVVFEISKSSSSTFDEVYNCQEAIIREVRVRSTGVNDRSLDLQLRSREEVEGRKVPLDSVRS